MIYLYEDSFEHLLNLINYLLKNKIKPSNIKNEYYIPNLLEKTYCPKLDFDDKLSDRIISKIGYNAFMTICHVYLSSNENKEILIYNFLLNSLKYRNKIIYMRNLDCVTECLKISKYVTGEAHRLKGFVRFRELNNNILYAEIEPENNILLILSNHFKNRLKNEYWIIKDNRRKLISLYDKKRFYIVPSDNFDINLKNEEDYYEYMWKSFYKTIGIKERKNERCRMNFMPKKYWKYIVEVKDEKSN